jgi:hypothetical protein
VTAAELYETTLRTMVELLEHPPGPGDAYHFRTALDAWERDRDVSGFVRWSEGVGMGSYIDGGPALPGPGWSGAAFEALRRILPYAARALAAGTAVDVELVPAVRWQEVTRRCARCGADSMEEWTVESLAARLWLRFVAEPEVASGRAPEVVAHALAAPDDPTCRRWLDDVRTAFERANVSATYAASCPRCGASQWEIGFLWITAPPVGVHAA